MFINPKFILGIISHHNIYQNMFHYHNNNNRTSHILFFIQFYSDMFMYMNHSIPIVRNMSNIKHNIIIYIKLKRTSHSGW